MKASIATALLVAAALLATAGSAVAEPGTYPPYDGLMTFGSIETAEDPEQFSWEVTLPEGQELKQLDERHAGVFWPGGADAFTIEAEAARDAEGDGVPTTLEVTEGDVLTLTVHHRAGDPSSGEPFKYPVVAGPPFELSNTPVTIWTPPAPPDAPGPSPAGSPPTRSAPFLTPPECQSVADPYPGTRYEGVPLSSIRAIDIPCQTARRVARGAHAKALRLPIPVSGVRRFEWHGWKVVGNLRPDSDRYRATRADGSGRVSWRF